MQISEIINDEAINEAVIALGKKMYPTDGNAVIFSGGSASGKGFVISNLLGLEGKVLDTDAIKKLAQQSMLIKSNFLRTTGVDISALDMKNPMDVNALHQLIDGTGLTDRYQQAFAQAAASAAIKPNIIIDSTMKSMTKFVNLVTTLQTIGYAKENIHIVWVINDYDIARQQNATRSRVVPEIILRDTHAGSTRVMMDILKMAGLSQYMNGDIWAVFNKQFVDTKLAVSHHGGRAVTDTDMIKLKAAGSTAIHIPETVSAKISAYTSPAFN